MRMQKKIISTLLTRTLKKITPKIGATLLFEPEWKAIGQIIFKNGKKSYFTSNSLDINSKASSSVAKDKDYTNFFLKSLGYPIIPGSKSFYSKEWADAIGSKDRRIDDAYIHAQKIGFPVIVKPNSGSQGKDVLLVFNKKELYLALNKIFKYDRIALVQKYVQGEDYRIVVFKNKIIAIYNRKPLCVIGDGKSSIEELFDKKQERIAKIKGKNISIDLEDNRIHICLKHKKLNLDSVPKAGEVVHLLNNANLSTGGDTEDVTDIAHPFYKKLAIKIVRDMNLKFCGLDLMIDGNINKKTSKFWIIEINSTPSLYHYSCLGKKQLEKAEDMYLEMLKDIADDDQ